jgi:hypothetical protein
MAPLFPRLFSNRRSARQTRQRRSKLLGLLFESLDQRLAMAKRRLVCERLEDRRLLAGDNFVPDTVRPQIASIVSLGAPSTNATSIEWRSRDWSATSRWSRVDPQTIPSPDGPLSRRFSSDWRGTIHSLGVRRETCSLAARERTRCNRVPQTIC